MNSKDIEIIKEIQIKLSNNLDKGYGPFLARVYDRNYNLISEGKNTVIKENCSICHAEINAIKQAQEKLQNWNLSNYDLGIYITSEPCIMCLGAIMWSGIKRVYYSTSSNAVEKITGFDEGFKPNWTEEFKKRNIEVYPMIEEDLGKSVLEKYMKLNGFIYKPR